mgnify:CR=1 FL=1
MIGENMRILVMSDAHGKKSVIEELVKRHNDAKTVLFLGDGAAEFLEISKRYPSKNFFAVSGNNDFFVPNLNYDEVVTVDGVRIFMTHGHRYHIGFGEESVIKKAKELDCKIALCGHTHIPKTTYADGIYYVNTGSVARSRLGPDTYAVIDIEKNGIVPIIMKV